MEIHLPAAPFHNGRPPAEKADSASKDEKDFFRVDEDRDIRDSILAKSMEDYYTIK